MLDRAVAQHPRPDAFLRRLNNLVALSRDVELELSQMGGAVRHYAAGDVVLTPGSRLTGHVVILSGWISRAIHLSDGGRQIVGFGLPGDLLPGHASPRHFAFYTATAFRETRTLHLDTARLDALCARSPALAEALHWTTDRDVSAMARTVERIGRRPARTRIAHLLVELSFRLELAGEQETSILPLRQQDVADACGLSLVHVNKTLRHYQREGLLSHRRGTIDLIDLDGLSALAGFSRAAFLSND